MTIPPRRCAAPCAAPRRSATTRSSARWRPASRVEEVAELTFIDPWFVAQLQQLVDAERAYAAAEEIDRDALLRMKRLGFSDVQLARLRGETEDAVRERRWGMQIHPVYNRVDTCAGEFPALTPYLYSTYADENESERSDRRKVIILGSGPIRIGQGVEFDYCCVQAALALRDAGFETIMVNSNPETNSTDFDVSDKLYFEPLTLEDVIEIVRLEQPEGVILQMGGQTPLKLAQPLEKLGVKILGTPVEAIDRAEDRERFEEVARKLGVRQPPNGLATSMEQAAEIAGRIGYPVLVRPSYVLGGRGMVIVYDEAGLRHYFETAVRREPRPPRADRPLPGRRVRGGRGRAVRRRDGGDRRGDAAHRGGGHPLRRQRAGAAAVPAGRPRGGGDARAHARASRWSWASSA